MNRYYVQLNDAGFIVAWSRVDVENHIEIQADEELFEKLEFVKVVNGVAELDTQEQAAVIERALNAPLSHIDRLEKENAEQLLYIIDIEEKATKAAEVAEQASKDNADTLLYFIEAGI